MAKYILQAILAERADLANGSAHLNGTSAHPLRLVAALQKVLRADVTLCLDMPSFHRVAPLQLHGAADPHQHQPADFGCRLAAGHRGAARSIARECHLHLG
jgi:hypothetical protein